MTIQQYSAPFVESIQLLDGKAILTNCHMVMYDANAKVGRLVLKETIERPVNALTVQLLGYGVGCGPKSSQIKEVFFDEDQELLKEVQVTFTLNKVSDWV